MPRPNLPDSFGRGADAIPAAFADRLNRIERELDELKRARPLTNASIEDGSLSVIDTAGNVRNVIGRQGDGSFDVSTVDPTDPTRFVLLSQLGFSAAGVTIDTQEATTATTWTDLATPGPVVTVDIGPTGRAIVMLSAWIGVNGGDSGRAGLSIDGAAPLGLNRVTMGGNGFGDLGADVASFRVVTALSTGPHTFKLVYETVGGTSCDFARRTLVVMPY